MIKPFSKSVWILPAAWGAFVPFWSSRRERVLEYVGTNMIDETNHDSPSSDFIMPTREEVMKVESFIAISDNFWQSTTSNNTSQWKLTGNLCEQ